ncbi:hypothetical protein QOZ80_4BG0350980 [Eleusine coracana subsp. coracana]|nr:hypothetical protein QOZ80_4BG0350980 [Eleusine coracana subsp. coracana]
MTTSPHVLVVDDSDLSSLVTSRVLEHGNIRVTSVDSPEQALMVLDVENDVKLILTIYHTLGGMSGYELLREVKESPNLNHIPVVMVFIDENYDDAQRCMDAGADGYIFKPIYFHMPFIMSFL